MRTSDVDGRKMAKAAAIGAVLGIPLPFIGPVLGAAAGAGYVYWKARRQGGTIAPKRRPADSA